MGPASIALGSAEQCSLAKKKKPPTSAAFGQHYRLQNLFSSSQSSSIKENLFRILFISLQLKDG
jgi:hypothetical protein